MPRPAAKPQKKSKPAAKARAKAPVAKVKKAPTKRAKPVAKAEKKAPPAVKPAAKKVAKPVAKKAVPAVVKPAPSKPAPKPALKLATPAAPLKFPAVKAKPAASPAAKPPAPVPAPVAATVPAAAEPLRSTAHLPRPGEAKDAWLARVAHDYYRFLYATALSITRSNDDAEDAVQNAVMNALKRLDQLTEPGAIVSWMAMITRNAALDLLRRKKRAPGGGGDATVLPLAAPDKESGYEVASDMRQILANAIAVLPLSYQEVVNARHFDGMEVEDIAKKFGVTENNVRVRLFRAYEKLRESVQVRKALGLPVE